MQSQYDPYLAKINEDVCPHEMVYMMTATALSLITKTLMLQMPFQLTGMNNL